MPRHIAISNIMHDFIVSKMSMMPATFLSASLGDFVMTILLGLMSPWIGPENKKRRQFREMGKFPFAVSLGSNHLREA
jgi:hypothetical protein